MNVSTSTIDGDIDGMELTILEGDGDSTERCIDGIKELKEKIGLGVGLGYLVIRAVGEMKSIVGEYRYVG